MCILLCAFFLRDDTPTLKMAITGEACAGKSSLWRRYKYNTFDEYLPSTIGMDATEFKFLLQKKPLRIVLFDLAGQQQSYFIRQILYRGTVGVAIVFDISSEVSIETLPFWIREVQLLCGEVPIALIGTKADLGISSSETKVKNMAKSLGAPYIQASAKLGNGCNRVFEVLAELTIPFLNQQIAKLLPYAITEKSFLALTKRYLEVFSGIRVPFTGYLTHCSQKYSLETMKQQFLITECSDISNELRRMIVTISQDILKIEELDSKSKWEIPINEEQYETIFSESNPRNKTKQLLHSHLLEILSLTNPNMHKKDATTFEMEALEGKFQITSTGFLYQENEACCSCDSPCKQYQKLGRISGLDLLDFIRRNDGDLLTRFIDKKKGDQELVRRHSSAFQFGFCFKEEKVHFIQEDGKFWLIKGDLRFEISKEEFCAFWFANYRKRPSIVFILKRIIIESMFEAGVVQFLENHVCIKGKRHNYQINTSNASVQLLDGRYRRICIIPAYPKQRKGFLLVPSHFFPLIGQKTILLSPIEAEVIAKIGLLAYDDEIADETIISQL